MQANTPWKMLPSLQQYEIGTSELDPFRSSILGPWSPLKAPRGFVVGRLLDVFDEENSELGSFRDVYPTSAKSRPLAGQSGKTGSSLAAMRRLFGDVR